MGIWGIVFGILTGLIIFLVLSIWGIFTKHPLGLLIVLLMVGVTLFPSSRQDPSLLGLIGIITFFGAINVGVLRYRT